MLQSFIPKQRNHGFKRKVPFYGIYLFFARIPDYFRHFVHNVILFLQFVFPHSVSSQFIEKEPFFLCRTIYQGRRKKTLSENVGGGQAPGRKLWKYIESVLCIKHHKTTRIGKKNISKNMYFFIPRSPDMSADFCMPFLNHNLQGLHNPHLGGYTAVQRGGYTLYTIQRRDIQKKSLLLSFIPHCFEQC